jgi:hypothetical protein
VKLEEEGVKDRCMILVTVTGAKGGAGTNVGPAHITHHQTDEGGEVTSCCPLKESLQAAWHAVPTPTPCPPNTIQLSTSSEMKEPGELVNHSRDVPHLGGPYSGF